MTATVINVLQLCQPEMISAVQEMINEAINEDVVWAKSSLEIRNQRCHAVKVCGVSPPHGDVGMKAR